MEETTTSVDATSVASNLVEQERMNEVWKKTIEMDLKLSALQAQTQELAENLKELRSKVEEIAETLDELEVIEEEESSSEDESNETVKVEIVTTPQETQAQEQMQEQTQKTPKSMMRKILLG